MRRTEGLEGVWAAGASSRWARGGCEGLGGAVATRIGAAVPAHTRHINPHRCYAVSVTSCPWGCSAPSGATRSRGGARCVYPSITISVPCKRARMPHRCTLTPGAGKRYTVLVFLIAISHYSPQVRMRNYLIRFVLSAHTYPSLSLEDQGIRGTEHVAWAGGGAEHVERSDGAERSSEACVTIILPRHLSGGAQNEACIHQSRRSPQEINAHLALARRR